jgi:hypothetical protein
LPHEEAMSKHGIEIYLGPEWVFIEAKDASEADELQRHSADVVPTRRVIQTAEGHVVLFATE